MPETPMTAARLRNTGRFSTPAQNKKDERHVKNMTELFKAMDPVARTATPIRPQGAGTACTGCNDTQTGTVVHMSGLDDIVNIDTFNNTITAQGGVRLHRLVEALAEEGLELVGAHDLTGRTLGGAIAAPSMGPGIGQRASCLSSRVTNLKMITSSGKLMKVSSSQKNLMSAIRSSYGLLGVIAEATLRVQPVSTFSASHRKLTVDDFCSVVDTLSNNDVGFKFYLMPYRDRVYLDLRRYVESAKNAYRTPWKIKDWGESTVLPNVCKSLNRLLPIHSVRYQLIDTVSEATQGIVNGRLVRSGNNTIVGQTGRNFSRTRDMLYSTWCFPATDFSVVAKAYQEFCRQTYAKSRYRCDIPAVGYRICRDRSSVLSPAFDEPMIALQTSSTQAIGWEDFVIDLADFAEHWAGVPLFSQTRSLRSDYAKQIYGRRLAFFRQIRRQLDPEDRLLTPFMAQYFQ
jgi:FAD/FMN-containing dehydrogenase